VGNLKLVMCLCKIFVEGNCHPRPGVAILTCRSQESSASIPIFYIPITQAIKLSRPILLLISISYCRTIPQPVHSPRFILDFRPLHHDSDYMHEDVMMRINIHFCHEVGARGIGHWAWCLIYVLTWFSGFCKSTTQMTLARARRLRRH